MKDGRIVAVGSDAEVLKQKGPKTKVIDAGGKTVLPGLTTATPIRSAPPPASSASRCRPAVARRGVRLTSRSGPRSCPKGKWIVIRYAFPTRLKEARFPTKAELDAVAPEASGPLPRRARGHGQLAWR